MPNNYFQFKQFTVYQDQCAMKVCTDACLFGAWVADKLTAKNTVASRVLDIGTGTGLLSLMLAQKINASFDAVEIDEKAFEQASSNFKSSNWNGSITAYHQDILQFDAAQKFDLIISNPPFYEKDLKSTTHNKNLAKHDSSLTLSSLIKTCERLLENDGAIALLLPYHRLADLQKETAANDLHIHQLLLMKQTPAHNYFRIGAIIRKATAAATEEIIIIKSAPDQYSGEFISSLKDYYLHL